MMSFTVSYVSVNHKRGFEFFYKPVVAFETFVALVFSVMNMPWGCMCKEYIAVSSVAYFVPEKGRYHFEQLAEHLEFRVLGKTVVVFEAS